MEYENKVLTYGAVHGKVRSHGQVGSGTNVARAGAGRAASRLTPPLPGKASPLSSCPQPHRSIIKDAQGVTVPAEQIVCVGSCRMVWSMVRAPSDLGAGCQ